MTKPTRYDSPPPPDTTPEPGVYPAGLDENFRKALNFAPGLMSYTKLKRFLDPDKKISAFVAGVGNLVSDRLLFGPEVIPSRYYFHPEQVDFRSKAGRQWRDDWQRANPGMVLIRPKELAEAERLIEQALANDEIQGILNAPGYCEAGIVSDVDGLRFRSWVDKLTRKAVIDLKTTRAETPEAFLDGMLKYGYDAQAALYLDQCEAIGLGQLTFAWIVISKTTNRAWVQELPPWAYWTGRRWRESVTKLYHRVQLLEEQLSEG